MAQVLLDSLESVLNVHSDALEITPLALSSFTKGDLFIEMTDSKLFALLQTPAPTQI